MRAAPLVAFDLGGVLLRICRTWEEGCAAAGVGRRPRRTDAAAESRRREVIAAYQEGRLACADFFPAYATTIGEDCSADDVRRVHDAWLLAEYDGVADLVERLHAAGVETGVLSNTNPSHWVRAVRADGGRAEFPTASRTRHPHASHLLGMSKPAPAIFRRYEELTGRAPSEIVFFDDLEENVAAAARAGWRAHLVDPNGDPAGEMARSLRDDGILG